MATYYSAFFSSGLLASHTEPYSRDPYSPSTPRVAPARLTDRDNDVTSTAQSVATTSSALPSITETMASPTPAASDRPRLRRRRSSITTSTSPVSALKSSAITPRTATASLQRLYTSSPTVVRSRSRAGSITDSFVGRTSITTNEATHSNSLVARIRSGSVGNSLRPRRTASRRVASAAPAPPPPTAPLPALPIPIASSSCGAPSTPRRPLARRSQPSDNLMIPINTPPVPRPLSPFLSDDYPMPSSPLSGQGIPSGLALRTSLGAFDYPSPIDTPGERFIGGYFPPFDMEMKEN